jgi:hypothetical protein
MLTPMDRSHKDSIHRFLGVGNVADGNTNEIGKQAYQVPNGPIAFTTDLATGCVIGSDGHEHPSEANALFDGLETTCGCGQPEEQHDLIRDALKHFDRDGTDWNRSAGLPGLVKLVAERPEQAAEFIAHVLAHENLIEYGGAVGGGWLTGRGRQYMESGELLDDSL